MTFNALNRMEKSWITSQGFLQIYVNQPGGIIAILSRETGDVEIQKKDINGLPEEVGKSEEAFTRFFESFYPRLSKIGKHNYTVYFDGRLVGGGSGKEKSGGKEKSEGKEIAKHVAEHAAVEVAAKTVGVGHVAAKGVAALLHTSELNKNAPYPEGPIRYPSPPPEGKNNKQ